ncbi:MAG: hypothetical protein VX776_08325, partial [Planctomycetota bacterium]|nr:hypothetical protein [Planctomycetota bacterium]
GEVHRDSELVAEVNLVFACLRGELSEIEQFYPEEFIRMLRGLDMYQVGVTPDGEPMVPPQFMLEAEAAMDHTS